MKKYNNSCNDLSKFPYQEAYIKVDSDVTNKM